MANSESLDGNSPAVLAHLTIMQGVIQRMAENSRYCKVWCVTLVSAILILVARTGEPRHALIALVPTLLFLVLDTYYLALERAFRDSYTAFVDKLHSRKLPSDHLYRVKRTDIGWRLVGRCLGSVSIWLFYPLVVITILAVWLFIFPGETPSMSGRE